MEIPNQNKNQILIPQKPNKILLFFVTLTKKQLLKGKNIKETY